MSLSIISSLPKGISPLAASPSTSLTDNLPGEFADLLSGELLGTDGLMAGISGKSPHTNGLEKDSKLTPGEQLGVGRLIAEISEKLANANKPEKNIKLTPEELLGASRLNVEISEKLASANRPEKDTKRSQEELSDGKMSAIDPSMLTALAVTPPLLSEISLSGKIGLQTGAEKLERQFSDFNTTFTGNEKKLDRLEQQRTSGLLGAERLISSAQSTGEKSSLENETAIFAAETNAGETNNASTNNLAGANLGVKQAHESPSADQSRIHAHLRENSWSQQFGERIVWLAKSDQQSAQININPPELGPVQMTLNLSGDQAKVTFASPHAEVRLAIENSLPQLKEMLSSAGINLGQTNVGANLAQQNPDNPYQNANGKHLADENAILPANEKTLNVTKNSALQRGRGLVDLFA